MSLNPYHFHSLSPRTIPSPTQSFTHAKTISFSLEKFIWKKQINMHTRHVRRKQNSWENSLWIMNVCTRAVDTRSLAIIKCGENYGEIYKSTWASVILRLLFNDTIFNLPLCDLELHGTSGKLEKYGCFWTSHPLPIVIIAFISPVLLLLLFHS